MANSGSEIVPNFVPILWISQPCPNRGYSQSITTCVILAFQDKFQNISHFNIRTEKPTYCGFHNFLVRFTIVRIFLSSKIFNNNASIVKFTGVQGLQEIKGPGI